MDQVTDAIRYRRYAEALTRYKALGGPLAQDSPYSTQSLHCRDNAPTESWERVRQDVVTRYLEKFADGRRVPIQSQEQPQKVLFVGGHGAGKSTLETLFSDTNF